LILKKITETNGKEQARKIIESVADDMATNIRYEIEKNGSSSLDSFEESLKIFNSVSNEMGFASSITKEHDGNFSVLSKNCILHKVALNHQDVICHGLHDRMIMRSLSGGKKKQQQRNMNVELKECIALGDNVSRHAITNDS
jgi:predicted ArsR family transcriptional regulator